MKITSDLKPCLLDAEVKIGELTSRIPKASERNELGQFDTAVESGKMQNAVVKQLGQKNVERFEQMAKHQDR